MTLATDLPPAERDALVKARDGAITALHQYADELEKRLPKMVDFAPMGEANYNYYLKHVLLLPIDATQVEMLGRAELARYRALEAIAARSLAGRSQSRAQQEHSARSGSLPRRLRKPCSRR